MTTTTAPQRSDAQRPKLTEIAQKAGVSVSTVSKVINGRRDIGAATRQKVEAILNEYGYQKSLVKAVPSRQIDIVFQDFEEMWAMELLKGVTETVSRHGISVTVTELKNRDANGAPWTQDILERRPLGVILIFSDLSAQDKKRFVSRQIPFVTLDPAGDPAPDSTTIRADNWTGGLVATRHLTSLGHHRIGIITGPMHQLCAKARYDGYLSALAEAGIDFDPSLMREGQFHVQDGFEHAMSLLTAPNRPTAIVAGNDLQAMGIYDAARQLGLSVPEDLSVVGFDDVTFSKLLSPSLTTVLQPLAQMAGCAANLLLEMNAGHSVAQDTVFPTTLVVRNSTAKPRHIN
ncbi:LacI family DNA-binding transcriptional regulator [Bifidobacterium oedipodis]|uniref:LacI family transcriptional regulator n=1 Tax=Bifidobacterium oedipodis TaxID=2675322 RepID=A0A7Y0ENU1_9BIFI|nr:LacI family DNA-binding transcriptional regulator [Bifidobacterium sp. DSM 109957]NMM93719.1 LacI family transcriptional regulator [Bifidobacterium sp. DSM 109957]